MKCELCGNEVIDVDGRVKVYDTDAGIMVCDTDECLKKAYVLLFEEHGLEYEV